MGYWADLGILVLVAGAAVRGYLGGLRNVVVLTLGLILILLLALAFGQAGTEYLVLHHQADTRIMPVLLQRLPLVITVSPQPAPLPDAGQRAAALVRQMALAPVYQDWLVMQPFPGDALGVTEHGLVARLFSLLLLQNGVFLSFLFLLLFLQGIIGSLLGRKRQEGAPGERWAAALLAGSSTLVLLSVVLTSLVPFTPLFFGFLASDLAASPLTAAMIRLGLTLLSAP